jgi:hypothetical protein
MSRTDAVEALYQDMAARHRSRFRSIHVSLHHVIHTIPVLNMLQPDPQGRRNREDRRRQAPIHQATPRKGSQIPSSSPRIQASCKQTLRREATIDFLLSFSGRVWGNGCKYWCFSYISDGCSSIGSMNQITSSKMQNTEMTYLQVPFAETVTYNWGVHSKRSKCMYLCYSSDAKRVEA